MVWLINFVYKLQHKRIQGGIIIMINLMLIMTKYIIIILLIIIAILIFVILALIGQIKKMLDEKLQEKKTNE